MPRIQRSGGIDVKLMLAGSHSIETVSVTGFKTCLFPLYILRLEEEAEFPTQEYVMPECYDWLGSIPGDDRPCKETGDDRDLDVILTRVSPGVRSWPYPDNQEGLESSASPAKTEMDPVNNYVCSCLSFVKFRITDLLVSYFSSSFLVLI